jgi:glycosyltransferase 2 family protein
VHVVLGVLLLAAVAGVVTHVPAGLGVLEAVFVMLLSRHVGEAPLLAALLAYRAVYYLTPLGLAAGLFAWIEMRPPPGDAKGRVSD